MLLHHLASVYREKNLWTFITFKTRTSHYQEMGNAYQTPLNDVMLRNMTDTEKDTGSTGLKNVSQQNKKVTNPLHVKFNLKIFESRMHC